MGSISFDFSGLFDGFLGSFFDLFVELMNTIFGALSSFFGGLSFV